MRRSEPKAESALELRARKLKELEEKQQQAKQQRMDSKFNEHIRPAQVQESDKENQNSNKKEEFVPDFDLDELPDLE